MNPDDTPYVVSHGGSTTTDDTWYGITNSTMLSNMLITTPAHTHITSASTIAPTLSISNATFDDSDITIRTKGGEDLRVAHSIKLMMDHLMLIVPDDRDLESNPALKSAYENYLQVYRRTVNPELAEAYDSYQMIKKLSKDDA
jgi:hypothetical protein